VTCAGARNAQEFLTATVGAVSKETAFTEEQGQVVERVAAHLAASSSGATVIPLLGRLGGNSGAVAKPLLNGILSGWPKNNRPSLSSSEIQTLENTLKTLPENARAGLLVLIKRWGLGDTFAASLDQSTAKLRQKLADVSLADETRVSMAKDLIEMEDRPENIQFVLKQVNLLTPPDLGTSFIRVLAESRNPDTGKALVTHWDDFTPTIRAAAVASLARRFEWAHALLDAIERGQIHKTDLTVDQWSRFSNHAQASVAERAQKLSGATSAITADRVEIVQKLLPLAKEQGNPARGKEVFKANCAVCHTINNDGGKVGPELTGIAARDRGEILIDIVDPNRSVEANYRSWNVSTKDGESFSGRLETETQTSVEILDVSGQKHVIRNPVFRAGRYDVRRQNRVRQHARNTCLPGASIAPLNLRSSGARFDEARERFKSRTFEKHGRGQLVVELIFDQRGKFGCGKRIQAHGCERNGRVDIAQGDAQHIGRKLRQSWPQRVARREMEGCHISLVSSVAAEAVGPASGWTHRTISANCPPDKAWAQARWRILPLDVFGSAPGLRRATVWS